MSVQFVGKLNVSAVEEILLHVEEFFLAQESTDIEPALEIYDDELVEVEPVAVELDLVADEIEFAELELVS